MVCARPALGRYVYDPLTIRPRHGEVPPGWRSPTGDVTLGEAAFGSPSPSSRQARARAHGPVAVITGARRVIRKMVRS